jgi:transposase
VIDIMTRSHVHVLAEAGVPDTEIADQLNISTRSARRIRKEAPPTLGEVQANAREGAPKVGRPSKADPELIARVQALLAETPNLRATEVLRRAKDWGYSGGRSAMAELVRRLRPALTTDTFVRYEGLPGEYGQFDFGEVVVHLAGGKRERVHFFAGRLKYSRAVHVALTPDQSAESVVRGLVEVLHAWGGAPREWVFDNPRTIRQSPQGATPIVLHPHLRDLIAEARCIPNFCLPAHGNQKGAVEQLVGYVKRDFFEAHTFLDRADLTARLQEWLQEVNERRPSRATGEPPAARMAEERAKLHPLTENVRPDAWFLREQRVVSPYAVVSFAGAQYGVDPSAGGRAVELRVFRDRIDLIDRGRLVGQHRRVAPGAIARGRADRAATLDVLHGRQRCFFRRECLRELGRPAEDFLTRLVHAGGPEDWSAPVAELFELLQDHGGERMLRAFAAAASSPPTVDAVARALRAEVA